MTGDIVQKLINSDAAQSLKIEEKVAHSFRKFGWPAVQSTYYADPETGKLREVDVVSRKVSFLEKKNPINQFVLFNFYCECKSLSDQHIILASATPSAPVRLDKFWLGHERKEIFKIITESLEIESQANLVRLNEYITSRTHPDGLEILSDVNLSLPDVDVIAGAFRETNSAQTREIESSVIWKTILSLFSAINAAKAERKSAAIDWIVAPKEFDLALSDDHIRGIAYFLDSEILSISFFHPVIFTKAKLWLLNEGKLLPVKSARLLLSNIDHSVKVIDLVDESFAEDYISSAVGKLDTQILESLKSGQKRLRELKWKNAQAINKLKKIATRR